LEFSRQIFEKSSNIKFHENPSSGRPVVLCGRTDGQTDGQTRRELPVAFRNTANAPKNDDHARRRVERFAVNLGEGKTVTMLMMMVIRVYGAREGVGQPLLVIDLLQFWMCSIYTFQHGFGRTTGEGHTLKVQAYTAARYAPSVIFPIPNIRFRHDTTLHFEYTLLLFLSLCSPDTDKPCFIYILKHHSQKPNCFKNSHINVLNKIVNTFLTNDLSRTYFRTPETSLLHFFSGLPSR